MKTVSSEVHSAVSVIIPAYNAEKHIEKAMQSLQQQTMGCWECIVVDDDSLDETRDAARKAADGDSRIKVYWKENGGASSARNYGFKYVSHSSTFLFFLDADDWLDPQAFEVMVKYLENNPNVGLLGCQFNEVDADGNFLREGHRSRIEKKGWLPRDLKPDELITPFEAFFSATGQGPFAMYRRCVFEKTDGWDETLWGHNDTDMFIQMALEAPVHYLPDRLYYKRVLKSSLVHRPGRMDLYQRLRAKWDFYPARTEEQKLMIRDAREYYYRIHRPLRHFKVAGKALGESLRMPSIDRFKWFLKLFKLGLSELLKFTILRMKIEDSINSVESFKGKSSRGR